MNSASRHLPHPVSTKRSGFALPWMIFVLGIVAVVVGFLMQTSMESHIRAAEKGIDEAKARADTLARDYRTANSAWQNTTTPAKLALAMKAHGLYLTDPPASRRIVYNVELNTQRVTSAASSETHAPRRTNPNTAVASIR